MPLDTDFHFPSPSKVSPDMESVSSYNIKWVQSWGLTRSTSAIARYERWRMGELAARAYPDATGEDLKLAADALGWYTIFDDQFDGPRGSNPQEVARLCQEILTIARRPGGARKDDGSMAEALKDIDSRATRGMSNSWKERYFPSWKISFEGYAREAEWRKEGTIPDIDTYFRVRDLSLGSHIWFTLIERVEKFFVPPEAWDYPLLNDLTYATSKLAIMVNDIVSWERENSIGDPINLVYIISRRFNCSPDEAIAEVIRRAREEIQKILRLQAEIPALGDAIKASPSQRSCLSAYVDALDVMPRCNYDWAVRCQRYSTDTTPVGQRGYTEDLLVSTLESR